MRLSRHILLLLALALPCEAAEPLSPAEISELRAQRKTLSQEATVNFNKKNYRDAIPLLEECNRIQEKIGELNTPNTAVFFLYLGVAHSGLNAAQEARRAHEASLTIAGQCAKAGIKIPNTIFTSNWLALGRIHRNRGELTRALPYLQQYYQTKAKTLPAGHLTLLISAGALADVYRDLRHYPEAVALLQKNLPAAQATLPADSIRLARLQLRMAENLINLGRHQESTKHLQSGLKILEKQPAGIDLIITLTVQASLHLARSEDAKVMPLYQRSQTILAALNEPKHPMHANLLSLISRQQLRQGNFVEALKTVNRAVQQVANTQGKTHPRFAQMLSDQAKIFDGIGQADRAFSLYQEALQIYTLTHGPENAILCASLQNLAQLHQRKGQFPQALKLLKRAQAIAQKTLGADHEETALILASLAELRVAMHDLPAAEPLLDRSLEIHKKWYGPDHARTLAIRGERAFLMEMNKKIADAHAEYTLIRKIQIADHTPQATHQPARIRNLMRLARTAGELGRRDEAADLYGNVLTLTRQRLGPEHREVATVLSNLARMHFQFKEYPIATECQQKALQLLRKLKLENDPEFLIHLGNLAEFHRQNQEPELQLNVLTEMLTRQQSHFQQVLGQLSEATALKYLHSQQTSITLFQSACAAAAAHSPKAVRLGADQLTLSKASLEEIRWAQSRIRTLGTTRTNGISQLTERITRLQLRLKALERRPNQKPEALAETIRQRATLEAELRTAKANLARLITKSDAQLARQLAANSAQLKDLARQLPARGVLIDFVRYRQLATDDLPAHSRYAAYLTFPPPPEPDTLPNVKRLDLGPAAPIDQAITELHRLMYQKLIAPRQLDPVLATLSQLIGQPLWKATRDAEHLLICPDAQLGRLPFELLKTGNKFWLDHKIISYLSSGRELARLTKTIEERGPSESKPTPAVVLGAVEFGSPKPPLKTDLHFRPLPHSIPETHAIAQALGKDTLLLTGTEASEARLKKITHPSVLHLSSHAVYFRSRPAIEFPAGESPSLHAHNPLLRCGIALAGINHLTARPIGMADDGLFTGLEAAQLNLHGTELVILSACESSVGEIHAGEGVISLRRAFRIAGAEAVLASHWPVSNAATQSLMKNFMAHWQSGVPRAEALRRAQRELRQNEDTASPYFWAAFTLTGQWR
ncbi:MAG: CHAT domain-containing protein [Verrucomicrobia subdivision 3 bacterium]|nr:CHAT domain-containing protein [Limisphaerales bacterium]